MMRVGLLAPRKIPEEGGGYTFEADIFGALLECASQTCHEFIVFTDHADISDKPIPSNVHIVRLRRTWLRKTSSAVRAGINTVARMLGLPHPFKYHDWIDPLLAQHRIDLFWNIVQHTATTMVPYIMTVWDLQHRIQPYFPELSVEGRWARWEGRYSETLRRGTYIITGTEVGRKEIEFLYQVPRERIKILPHPTPRFVHECGPITLQRLREKYRIPETYLLYPAQFWPHKNHITLLRALHILRQKYGLVIALVCVGADYGNRKYIGHVITDLSLQTQVYTLGFVPREDLVALYRNAFALIYLSLCGPENLPPLEAFALGCPVIAAEVPGASEQLGDAAFLVDGKNAEAAAEAVYQLMTYPWLREGLIEKGKQRSYRFSAADFLRGVFNILDEFEPVRRCWSNTEPFQPRYLWGNRLLG